MSPRRPLSNLRASPWLGLLCAAAAAIHCTLDTENLLNYRAPEADASPPDSGVSDQSAPPTDSTSDRSEPQRCLRALPSPPRPNPADASAADTLTVTFGMTTSRMADTTVGFDVDGIATSCDSLNRFDPSSATCAVRIGAVTGNEAICDTTTPSATCGVDNAFNRLRKKSNGVYGSEALPQLFEFNAGDDICQRATALVTVEGFNGLANDPEVSVTLDVSMRLTAPPSSDGGTSIALDASSSAPDGGLPACRVAADGTFSVESFEWSPSQVSQVKLTGYVSQSQLVVDLGAEGAVPFPTRLGVVTFRGGYLVGQLQYNNMPLSTQIPLTPTMARSSSFRMVDGTLGSTLALDTTVGLARYLGGAGLALVSLCESADMPFPPVPRGSTTKESCNGLSTVLRLGYTSVNSNPAVSAEKRPTIYTAPPIANACSFQF